MNVLHLTGANIWGGNEEQLKNLITDTTKLGVINSVFCFKNTPVETYCVDNKISYFSVDAKKPHSLRLAKELSNYIKKNNVTVIHIHTTDFVTTIMISGILFKINKPIVFSKKGISDKSSILSPIKYNYTKIKRIICVSDAVKSSMKEVIYKKYHDKIITIYDGISTSKVSYIDLKLEEYNISKDKFLIGNIANHTDAKDLTTLIHTANYLIKELKRTDVHFIQIGKKSALTDNFIKLIDELNLNDYFTFTGSLSNASSFLKTFSCYIMSSKTEGLPVTVCEAFKAKTPVVTTNAGGIPEAVIDDKTGFICNIGDYTCLANKLNKLLNDHNLQESFSKNAYDLLLEKFNAKDCAIKTFNTYKEVSSI